MYQESPLCERCYWGDAQMVALNFGFSQIVMIILFIINMESILHCIPLQSKLIVKLSTFFASVVEPEYLKVWAWLATFSNFCLLVTSNAYLWLLLKNHIEIIFQTISIVIWSFLVSQNLSATICLSFREILPNMTWLYSLCLYAWMFCLYYFRLIYTSSSSFFLRFSYE